MESLGKYDEIEFHLEIPVNYSYTINFFLMDFKIEEYSKSKTKLQN